MTETTATAPPTSNEPPEFAFTIRGYDRNQVDDYIERLREFLRDAERRAESLESRLDSIADGERPAAVGERVSRILDLAQAEAGDMIERARTEAAATYTQVNEERQQVRQELEQARRDAEAIRARAIEAAAALVEHSESQAMTDAQQIRAQAERDAAAVHRLRLVALAKVTELRLLLDSVEETAAADLDALAHLDMEPVKVSDGAEEDETAPVTEVQPAATKPDRRTQVIRLPDRVPVAAVDPEDGWGLR